MNYQHDCRSLAAMARLFWTLLFMGAIGLCGCDASKATDANAGAPPTPQRRVEHSRLAALENRTPSDEASLLLWQEWQDRYYAPRGIDSLTCQILGEQMPVQCLWTFAEDGRRLDLEFRWDARIVKIEEIDLAISKVSGDLAVLQPMWPRVIELVHQAFDKWSQLKPEAGRPQPVGAVGEKVSVRMSPPQSSAQFTAEAYFAGTNILHVGIAAADP